MTKGKDRILSVLSHFNGKDGEPNGDTQKYILKAMWLMMLSEFEANVKEKVEGYIDNIKMKNISDIHVTLLIRNFHGNKEEPLTLNKIMGFYKRNPSEIQYRNFTRDRVPKYKSDAIDKLFKYLGIFFTESELTSLSILDSIASTRDSIAHGDIGVQITRSELEDNLTKLDNILDLLSRKLS